MPYLVLIIGMENGIFELIVLQATEPKSWILIKKINDIFLNNF